MADEAAGWYRQRVIFGRKRKKERDQLPATDEGVPARSLFNTGRSMFEPPASAEPAVPAVPAADGADAEGVARGASAVAPSMAAVNAAEPSAASAVPHAPAIAADGRPARPRIVFTAARSGAEGFTSRLPLRGELAGVIPGPDRPDYCLVELDEPIDFEPPADFDRDRIHQSAIDQMVLDLDDVLPISALVIVARQVGTQVSPTMADLAVNVGYVLDDSLFTDDVLEFDKVHFAAVATLNLE